MKDTGIPMGLIFEFSRFIQELSGNRALQKHTNEQIIEQIVEEMNTLAKNSVKTLKKADLELRLSSNLLELKEAVLQYNQQKKEDLGNLCHIIVLKGFFHNNECGYKKWLYLAGEFLEILRKNCK